MTVSWSYRFPLQQHIYPRASGDQTQELSPTQPVMWTTILWLTSHCRQEAGLLSVQLQLVDSLLFVLVKYIYIYIDFFLFFFLKSGQSPSLAYPKNTYLKLFSFTEAKQEGGCICPAVLLLQGTLKH